MMNTKKLLAYGLQALISTGLAYLFLPAAFVAGALSAVAFGVLSAALMAGALCLERFTWQKLGVERAQSLGWRVPVRVTIYLVGITLVIYLVGMLLPALLFLPAGLLSAFVLAFVPVLLPASYIGLW